MGRRAEERQFVRHGHVVTFEIEPRMNNRKHHCCQYFMQTNFAETGIFDDFRRYSHDFHNF